MRKENKFDMKKLTKTSMQIIKGGLMEEDDRPGCNVDYNETCVPRSKERKECCKHGKCDSDTKTCQGA